MKQILRGVDVKVLQYEEYAKSICHTKIDLKNIIEEHLIKKQIKQNCIMINIEKDAKRYYSTVEELKKISFNNFIHLKATYWKEKNNLENDLTFILNFLKQFNPDIDVKQIHIDEFSEVNDRNIHIQDGPLACYCSHLRSMIYGYLNFEEYTIVIEDDISITNTENIEKYLKCIPDDWDIICMNAAPKNQQYTEPYYKFVDDFHSTHFYIIKNKCLPILFKNMYPITDQVDVLISNLVKTLNIYNIPETVYQKNIVTNTQNNLHVIFNSPNYQVVRDTITNIKTLCLWFADKILPSNKVRNKIIVDNLIYDILYGYILNNDKQSSEHVNKENYVFDSSNYKKYEEYEALLIHISHFIQCCKKGINVKYEATGLLKNILFTLNNFTLHKEIDKQYYEKIKAYSFGSTAHTYILKNNKIIIKKYNDKLRWTTEGHDDSFEIFNNELKILQKINHLNHIPKVMGFCPEEKTIKLTYEGESLYNNFKLPKNWKKQIKEIFSHLTSNKILYPEFRLQNILVLENKISFIDFGLAKFDDNADNSFNCQRFLKLLDLMNKKFKNNKNKVHQLSGTLLDNENLINIV